MRQENVVESDSFHTGQNDTLSFKDELKGTCHPPPTNQNYDQSSHKQIKSPNFSIEQRKTSLRRKVTIPQNPAHKWVIQPLCRTDAEYE